MSHSDNSRLYWFALQTVPNIGALRYTVLVKRFGSPQVALEASVAELKRIPDFGEKVVESIKTQVDWEEAEKQLATLNKSGAQMITILDDVYPEPLKRIYDPPPFLLIRGNLTAADQHAVAIVGSRVCTAYGKQIAEQLARGLVDAGMTVVSGLARGIDSGAHRSALKAGGRTIAVLGCGLDIIYPPENEELYDEISASGAVVSEFPFGLKPDKFNFPTRNRIISGLSKGVVVVEAGRMSGALLTVQHAIDQNREVFAVPGNINSPASAGTNELLKQGAIPVTSLADVLLALGYHPDHKLEVKAQPLPELPDNQLAVYNSLSNQPQQIDALSQRLCKPVAEVLSSLFSLEMEGLVRQLPGKLFLREP
jgi:DNA processing protein